MFAYISKVDIYTLGRIIFNRRGCVCAQIICARNKVPHFVQTGVIVSQLDSRAAVVRRTFGRG